MSFPAPNLDDRRFQDFVDEAKQRIPQYTPEWTNHNLSDPGIALIELFAWMTESAVFRLNQVPDRLYVKFLELLGISPYPAAPAHTILTFWLSSPDVDDVVVPRRTQAGTLQTDAEPSVAFLTTEDLHIRQPELIGCLTARAGATAYEDHFAQLGYPDLSLAVFPSEEPRAGDAIYFGFAESCAANVLFLEVDCDIHGIGIDPHRPPIRWEAWTGEEGNEWAEIEIDPGGDRTGGLNRPGSILLYMPFEHDDVQLGPTRAYWIRAVMTGATPTYEESPRIHGFSFQSVGGRAHATQGEPADPEVLGVSNGEPGQSFRVRHTPVLPRRVGETVRVVTPAGVGEWQEVADFVSRREPHAADEPGAAFGGSGPESPHYTWDSTTGEITFGPEVRYPDGSTRQHGKIPPRGSQIEVTGYRFGGGARGNVGAGTVAVLTKTIPYIARVENRRPATGGIDPETVDNAKLRGPMSILTGNRAVTTADFEYLAREADRRVARAWCSRAGAPGDPVRLVIVPRSSVPPAELRPADLVLPADLWGAVAEFIEERRIIGTEVVIGGVEYQPISVVARVRLGIGRDADSVRERCLRALYRFVNPLVGGRDGRGWPWGGDVNIGSVFSLLGGVDGVAEVEDALVFAVDLDTGERIGLGQNQIEIPLTSLVTSAQHYVVTLPAEEESL